MRIYDDFQKVCDRLERINTFRKGADTVLDNRSCCVWKVKLNVWSPSGLTLRSLGGIQPTYAFARRSTMCCQSTGTRTHWGPEGPRPCPHTRKEQCGASPGAMPSSACPLSCQDTPCILWPPHSLAPVSPHFCLICVLLRSTRTSREKIQSRTPPGHPVTEAGKGNVSYVLREDNNRKGSCHSGWRGWPLWYLTGREVRWHMGADTGRLLRARLPSGPPLWTLSPTRQVGKAWGSQKTRRVALFMISLTRGTFFNMTTLE